MFDGLQDKLQDVFNRLKGEGRVTPEALDAALREVRMAFLEADVNFNVVKAFIERVSEQALGQEVLRDPHPGAADRQDRLRRAGRPHGAGGPEIRLPTTGRRSSCSAASRGRARRPPPASSRAPAEARPQAAARRRRPPAPRRRRAAQGARRAARRAGLQPERRRDPVAVCRQRRRASPASAADDVILDTAGRLHVDAS